MNSIKKGLCLISLVLVFTNLFAQKKEKVKTWTSFTQGIDASFLKEKVKFRISASAKVDTNDPTAWAGIWARVDNKEGGTGFFDNMWDRKITINEWKTYIVEGELNKDSEKLFFGGLCLKNGKFYFDNFEVFIENDKGKFEKIEIENSSFEIKAENQKIEGWNQGINSDNANKIKGYFLDFSKDNTDGKFSLFIEGKGIEKDSTNIIGPREGFTPQIGTMVSMLNNMTARVEAAVENLNQKQIDWLFDNNANSFGALIMHLAAAEKWYQVYTFENRGFNEQEKEEWEVALNLGEEAREKFKGHDVEYYLKKFRKVREKTIEELKKKDDAWLAEFQTGSSWNNHFSWFHVTEHQSSHLGQILMLKKRLPKEKKDETKIENTKIETNK